MHDDTPSVSFSIIRTGYEESYVLYVGWLKVILVWVIKKSSDRTQGVRNLVGWCVVRADRSPGKVRRGDGFCAQTIAVGIFRCRDYFNNSCIGLYRRIPTWKILLTQDQKVVTELCCLQLFHLKSFTASKYYLKFNFKISEEYLFLFLIPD
jgi:hypothetical protein